MTDTATAATSDATSTDTTKTAITTEVPAAEKDWKAEYEKAEKKARDWEARSKGNHEAVKELEALKRTSMTDLEKAVADARTEAKTEAAREHAAELVDARIEAAAAGKVPADRLAKALAPVDRRYFIGDDGTVDVKKVADFVSTLATDGGPADLGQGNRGGAAPTDMNSLIRNRMKR